MAVNLSVCRPRYRYRISCRVRRATVCAEQLRGARYGEEAAFTEIRVVATGGITGTGAAWDFMHPKSRRAVRLPNTLCDPFAFHEKACQRLVVLICLFSRRNPWSSFHPRPSVQRPNSAFHLWDPRLPGLV